MAEGIKREFRIDSSDSARPAADINSEPHYHAQGLKPKPRVIAKTEYSALDAVVSRGKNKPVAKVILRTVTYDDGVTIDTTVGEDNVGYQQFLIDGKSRSEGKSGSTRLHAQPKAPTNSKKSSKE